MEHVCSKNAMNFVELTLESPNLNNIQHGKFDDLIWALFKIKGCCSSLCHKIHLISEPPGQYLSACKFQ